MSLLLALLSAEVEAPVGGGYDDEKPRKKKYLVEKNGQLLVLNRKQDAIEMLEMEKIASEPDDHIEDVAVVETVEPIQIAKVQQEPLRSRTEPTLAMLNAADLQVKAIAAYADAMDEDDIEFLLMAIL